MSFALFLFYPKSLLEVDEFSTANLWGELASFCRDAPPGCQSCRKEAGTLCAAAITLRDKLLETRLLKQDLPVSYIALDSTPYAFSASPGSPSREDYREARWNSVGMSALRYSVENDEDKQQMILNNHFKLTTLVERAISSGLGGNVDEVVKCPEFVAIRSLLLSFPQLGIGVIDHISFACPLNPRPFLERWVVRPIRELVTDLSASTVEQCRT